MNNKKNPEKFHICGNYSSYIEIMHRSSKQSQGSNLSISMSTHYENGFLPLWQKKVQLWYTLLPLCDHPCCAVLCCFSRVQLFVTPWTVAYQAPLSMGFSRQEYWSGLLCPPPADLPNPVSQVSCIVR